MMEKQQARTETTEDAPLYNYSFFDEGFRSSRKLLFPVLVLPLIFTSLSMWACLSLYFGSLVPNNNLAKLEVYAIDLDHGFLGSLVIDGVKAAQSSGEGLDWRFDASVTSSSMSQDLVLDERAWAVLQVSPNASSSLDAALSSGLASYNPLSTITLYFVSGRNQITANSKVVPAILAVINPILTKAAIQHTVAFLSANTASTTALTIAERCPQCLAAPFAVSEIDLRPFDVAPATGTTMVGMIFLLTFAFSIFQILRTTGTIIGSKLNLRSALLFRTTIALLAYLFMSLWYSLINLAFGIPMDRFLGRGGFVVFWMLNWCTMGAVGLPMESLHTVLGLKYSGYFLTFWIIVNVSAAFTSFELMPRFYLYGYGLPFYNSIQGARTIIFGTKSHLGVNFGVLIAWMAVGLIGMLGFTAWTVKRNERKRVHALP